MEKFVAVAGNIGVGKTTLVQKLCDNLDWTPFFEPERENPYLADANLGFPQPDLFPGPAAPGS